MTLKEWLLKEWKRSGLPFCKANQACGVANAATRKYFDQGHLWYFPPAEMFAKIQRYANTHGRKEGKPYFSMDGTTPLTEEQWTAMRAKFHCPHGVTNVWERAQLSGNERTKISSNCGKSAHLNQKPLDLIMMLVEASSDIGDIIWEPFGGLFTCCLASDKLSRQAYGSEINLAYYNYGIQRLIQGTSPDKSS